MITFGDFKKIELRVGTVITAERVEKSAKLLRIDVDLGSEKRQIMAGIGKRYEPAQLQGRQIVIVANMEPRMLMGFESQGMLLAANGQEGPALLCIDSAVLPGTEIQ